MILLTGAIIFIVISQPSSEKFSDKEKEKAIANLLGRKANISPQDEKKGSSRYKGKYIAFDYPAKAIIYEYKNEDSKLGSDGESFSFDIKNPRVIFNMMSNLTSGSYLDIPSIRLREERSYEYKKKEVTVSGVKGVTYLKSGPESEKSGFFIKDGRLYTISMTGSDDKTISEMFDQIILSVSFEGKKEREVIIGQ